MGVIMYIILGSATALKIALFVYCRALQHKSDSIMALAEDHRNDIISNSAAIACGAVASYSRKLWYIDPVGGILASIYIIYSWALICKAQVCPRRLQTNVSQRCQHHAWDSAPMAESELWVRATPSSPGMT